MQLTNGLEDVDMLALKKNALVEAVDLLFTEITVLRSRVIVYCAKLDSVEGMCNLSLLRKQILHCEVRLGSCLDKLTETNSHIKHFERSHLC